ncbi:DUF2207 domain-containing protein [Marinicella sp. S1101]|uniref:DUF2207 domain-containing protein n=1 Tax=Marinicella marina TaxID=2996016 RepID=UPI002260D966|nr:DUF2207 domain-containing protein [Marinicella marina]MCX7554682.1 DUF2207 domain-containing protein [Marinicella marina]MDJ1140747.1 DUF2207 domain-containing protein [Marinicella marina]
MQRLILLLVLMGSSTLLLAEEYIKHYHSDIELKANGDVYVTETITVNVEHHNIKRGIYRDFPTIYKTPLLTKSTVDFEVISVTRNGVPEPHHTEQLSNGVRVYIGTRSQMVERGEQTYQIKYRTNRQVAFMDSYDRFYWNVTGNDWRFRMNQVTAQVSLPDGVSMAMVNSEVWTGFGGESSADFNSEINDNELKITSTQPLAAYQGMTFSLQIPKGHIIDNSSWLLDFLSDNMMWVLMVLAFLSLLMFYTIAWREHGQDPEPGVIMPLFYPPKDLSPAAMRFVMEEQSNHKNLTAALINLAVKGYVKLKKIGSGYLLEKQDTAGKQLESMSSGEKIIMRKLLSNRNSITINKTYDKKINKTNSELKQHLKKEFKAKCFKDNTMLGVFGIMISVVILMFYLMHMNIFGHHIFWGIGIAGGVLAYGLYQIYHSFKSQFNLGNLGFVGYMLYIVFSGSGLKISGDVLILAGFLVVINGVFIWLLKSPTPFGRELMDKIEGFKLYLSTAEQHRLDIMHPPEMTPQIFEKYLPYAMALSVENQWSQRFANHLKASGLEQSQHDYSPNWYSGGRFDLSSSSNNFSTLSTGMASTVSAASVPPSSSGGGGGGFSGGGGGGGGGGGW